MGISLRTAIERIQSAIKRGNALLRADMSSERILTALIRDFRGWDGMNRDILEAYDQRFVLDYDRGSSTLPKLRGEIIEDSFELRQSLTERIESLISIVERMSLSSRDEVRRYQSPPRVFIVHGHDHELLFQIKDFLQNGIGLPEPLVLFQQPNRGRTLIEKFEECADQVDVALVLLTPDDFGGKSKQTESRARARQNVIFELGFFVGKFGRNTGRTIVLHKGDLEIPSDLSGVVYIDVSKGVAVASEDIRRELSTLK